MTKAVEVKHIANEYSRTRNRLILLDYDGTLVPFDPDHRTTSPGEEVVSLLHAIAADTRNCVILISGRDKEYLETHFKKIPIILVAEHGGYFKTANGNWNTVAVSSMSWVPCALAALQTFVFQYEGSFVEQKIFSLAWHYRKIAAGITEFDKRQILAAIEALPVHEQFVIYDSEFTIELRAPGIDKGTFVANWVGGRYFDFIMSLGDSQTDEDIFKFLGEDAYTIKVGNPKGSSANFFLESQEQVLPFLHTLLREKEGNEFYGLEVAKKSTH